jgi:flagellar biosynthesis protein FliR
MQAPDASELASVFWAFLRALPLGLLAVRASRGVIGVSVALSLCLALAVGLGSGVRALPLDALSAGELFARVLRELCVGSLVALSLLTPLMAVSWGVRFSELVQGTALGRAGPLSTLYGLSALFLALTLGLHRSLLVGLAQSRLVAPSAAATFHPEVFAFGVVQLVGEALAFAVALGMPLLLSVLLLEATFALLARLFGRPSAQAWGPLLARPLFVLIAGLLAVPLVARVPEALRVGLRLSRELAQRAGS